LGLELSGVDIITTKSGPAVMEVNCNPGFKGLEEATGENIAKKIIVHAEKFAQQYVPHDVV
jgi:ribosomal protein S6--L-glutamate ligase